MSKTERLIDQATYGGLVHDGREHQRRVIRVAQIRDLQRVLMDAHARAGSLGLKSTQAAIRDAGQILIEEKNTPPAQRQEGRSGRGVTAGRRTAPGVAMGPTILTDEDE